MAFTWQPNSACVDRRLGELRKVLLSARWWTMKVERTPERVPLFERDEFRAGKTSFVTFEIEHGPYEPEPDCPEPVTVDAGPAVGQNGGGG